MNTNNNTASALLTIDLSAIANNYRFLNETVGTQCHVAGIVKADAYGLGVEEIVPTLFSQGCDKFFVATLDEALHLRSLNKDMNIRVLGGLFSGAENEYLNHNIVPVLNSLEEIARWQKLCKDKNETLPAIIHFDTGMNRLGLGKDETNTLLSDKTLIEGIDLKMIMSHFACADEREHPMNKKQRHDFANIAGHFPSIPRSINNSSGIFRCPEYHYNLVRPGIAMYGGNPTPEAQNLMSPVVSLDCRILQIRNVSKNETIGYSATHNFGENAVTATIALGYADGFLRSNSSSAKVFWKGQACPVLGRVSMDLVTIDIGHLKEPPQIGDFIEILGQNQGIDDLAETAGTISYEILTSLGSRYQRHYIKA